jgi:hypothetical protein
MFKFLICSLLILFSSCSSKNEYTFSLMPDGAGISRIGKVDTQMEYLKETCKGTSRNFKLLIDPKDQTIQKSLYLQRYDLELIELIYFQGVMDNYEMRLTQSGCLDSQLAIDLHFNKKSTSLVSLIENIRRAIKDVNFSSYSVGVQDSTLDALTYLTKNYKRKCKTVKNFVAYKKRTLCNFKKGELHYQLLWGFLDNKEVINLSSSYSPF